jgi:hypothetical protein
VKRLRDLRRALLLAACLSAPSLRAAEPTNDVVVQRLSPGAIRIDGVLDEPPWRANPAIANLVQVEPRPGVEPSEVTQVWLYYSQEALYVAVRSIDRTPSRLVATDMRRDADIEDQDNIEIVLDTFNDDRNGYYFATNPVGALVDGRITENRGPSLDWDGIWQVRTRSDAQGWTAEFEIPFKTIGFNPSLDRWGFNISRHLARLRETSRWASPPLDIRFSQVANAGHISGMEGLSQGIGLDIKPYGITGFTRDINNPHRWKAAGDAGADVFYRITANLVSATTFNTDFAETEVDNRQVNLSRFPLFFPEKRSFFLEDAGIFEFGGGDRDELMPFFSRRIGLVEGNEIPIRVGEKLTGKVGRFDVGLLNVQTGAFKEDDEVNVDARNLTVARVKTNFGSQSYIGGLFTNGDPGGAGSNRAGGLDLRLATSNLFNRGKNMNLTLFGSKTWSPNVSSRDTAFGGSVSYPNDLVDIEYRWMQIGERYEPALGFVRRNGVRSSSFNSEISPRPRLWNIRQMSFEFQYQDYYSLEHRATETREFSLTPFQWQFNSGDMVSYDWSHNTERLFEPWEISDGVVLPTGSYGFNSHRASFRSSSARPLAVDLEFGSGSFFGGTRKQIESELTWRKDRHLTSSLGLERNWISLADGEFTTTILMCRLDYSFTPFLSLANFVQYDNESDNIGLQSRLRWILKPGNEFIFVLNNGWQQNALDRFENAQTRFRVKFDYTFRF